jgi:hypothetical protein
MHYIKSNCRCSCSKSKKTGFSTWFHLWFGCRGMPHVLYCIVLYCCDGVRLWPCRNGPLTGPLSIPQVIYVCGYAAVVEWYWQGKTEGPGEKPASVPLWPPQIPHGLTWARTRASTVRSRRQRSICISTSVAARRYSRRGSKTMLLKTSGYPNCEDTRLTVTNILQINICHQPAFPSTQRQQQTTLC